MSDSAVYQPDPIGPDASLPELISFVQRENARIAAALVAKLDKGVEFLSVQPAKRFEGLTVGADGTNWNPGGGKGVYTYYSGAWNKLG